MIRLYTTNCPQCKVLEAALKNKRIEFEIVSGEDAIREKGYHAAPLLEVDGEVMTFPQAVRWVNAQEVNMDAAR